MAGVMNSLVYFWSTACFEYLESSVAKLFLIILQLYLIVSMQ